MGKFKVILFAILFIFFTSLLLTNNSSASGDKKPVKGVPQQVDELSEQFRALAAVVTEQQETLKVIKSQHALEMTKLNELVKAQGNDIKVLKSIIQSQQNKMEELAQYTTDNEEKLTTLESSVTSLNDEFGNKYNEVSNDLKLFKEEVKTKFTQISKALEDLNKETPAEEDPNGYTISGKMVDANGKPFYSGIAILDANGKMFSSRNYDQSGNFSIKNVPSGTYRIFYFFKGYEMETPNEIVVNKNNISGFQIKLKTPTYSVSGKALASDGSPLVNKLVRLTNKDHIGGYWPNTTEDGSFNLEGLVPGRYVLTFGDTMNPLASKEIIITNENQSNVIVQGLFQYSVSGKLIDSEGKPFYTYFNLLDSSGNSYYAYGRGDGFIAPNLPNGEYKIKFFIEPYQSLLASSDKIIVNGSKVEGLEIKINAPTYSVVGKALDQSGLPIGKQTIYIYNPPNVGWGEMMDESMRTTSTDGTFVITGLPNGTYTLRVGPAIGEVTISNGNVTGLVIGGSGENPSGYSISGKILDVNGKQIRSIIAMVDENGKKFRDFQTDAGGFFTIKNIPNGTYHIEFGYTGYKVAQPVNIVVRNGNIQNLTIHLSVPTYSITGKALAENGTPLQGKIIFLREKGTTQNNWVPTLLDGSFSVAGIAPGNYILIFGDYRNPDASVEITVTDQDITGLTVQGNYAYSASGKLVDSEGKSFYTPFYLIDEKNQSYHASQFGEGFIVSSLPNGVYKIRFYLPYYQPLLSSNEEVTVNGGKIEGLEIKLNAATYSASGKVLDKNGNPISNEGIYISTSPQNAWGISFTTGPDGSFKVTGLPNGNYTLFIKDYYNPLAKGDITINNGNVENITIQGN